MAPGKVYLVGAGPGPTELLTLKAARLLEACDVIIYDRLVQQDMLAVANPAAERIYMGKAPGRHESRQEEVHELLVRKAREGKLTVRLKGGDPYVFGRGGEEAEYLSAHGVPFEVVPGVSSALAAPARAGIAVTHRDASSAVAIVTGHEANRAQSRTNWDALAGIDTLVFLMSVNNVGRIAKELLDRGRSPDTPAAMIQMAFWPGERVVTGTLATIADEVQRTEVLPPATLVIGDVVRLREKLGNLQTDACQIADDRPFFQPAPGPDPLFRLATGGLASQVFRLALAASLFDQLEQWRTAKELAVSLRCNTEALTEMLRVLISAGLIEAGPHGFRNLELASRYLVDSSPQNLKPALLYQASSAEPWQAFFQYLMNGRRNGAAWPNGMQYTACCECLARFSAPYVMHKADLGACRSVLIAGWAAGEYRSEALRRWPALAVDVKNPFTPRSNGHALLGTGQYSAVLFSGILQSCESGQPQQMIEAAADLLDSGGRLFFHDVVLGADGVPERETALADLARHVVRGGCRSWSYERLSGTLGDLGFGSVRSHTMPAGFVLVSALKRVAGPRRTLALNA